MPAAPGPLRTATQMDFKSEVIACRVGAAAALGWACTHQEQLDAVTARLWDRCKSFTPFAHDSWEPMLVVVCWIAFTLQWYVFDMYVPQLRRYHIQRSTEMRHWKYEGGHRKQEVLLYILPLVAFDFLYPRRELPEAAPTFGALASEVLLCLFFYDLLFSFAHYTLHKTPWLYRAVHAKHHARRVQRATEALRLTAAEEVLDVACSIAAVNLTRAHPMSRSIYNVVIVYLLIELHSGYDFPWMLQNVVPLELWGGSRRHDAHHADSQKYFQKFFTYGDALLGLCAAKPRSANRHKTA